MTGVEGLDNLSNELKDALQDIETQFAVNTAKLKEISQEFERELQEGLKKDGGNIVRDRCFAT